MKLKKFRAWDVDKKKFLDPEDFMMDGNGHLCLNESQYDNRKLIVTQTIGKFDKNGQELYEGDVIEDVEGNNTHRNDYLIEDIGDLDGATGIPSICMMPLQQRCTTYAIHDSMLKTFVLTGNKFENPELITENER